MSTIMDKIIAATNDHNRNSNFSMNPTKIYLGRHQEDQLIQWAYKHSAIEIKRHGTAKYGVRRQVYGLWVYTVDAENHLEVT